MTAEAAIDNPRSILQSAAFALAEHGAPRSLGELSAVEPRLGESDLVRRFGNVDNLVRAIFAEFLAPSTAAMRGRLANASTSLAEALRPFVRQRTDGDLLIAPFLQAALEAHGLHGGGACPPLLEPLLRALRKESGLPPPADLPARAGEAQIVVAMLADLAVLAGPGQALGLPMRAQRASALSLGMMLAGAATALRSLHARPDEGASPRSVE